MKLKKIAAASLAAMTVFACQMPAVYSAGTGFSTVCAEENGLSQIIEENGIIYEIVIDHAVVTGTLDGYGTDFVIADTINGIPVTEIGVSACEGLNIRKLVLPDSVKIIGDHAFSGCRSLSAVELGSVEVIGDFAFLKCTALSDILIENPDCAIGVDAIPSETIITAPQDSKAIEYAMENGNRHIVIFSSDDPGIQDGPGGAVIIGDANLSGSVEIADAVMILQSIADPSFELRDTGAFFADCYNRGDGIDAQDALAIQLYCAELVSELPVMPDVQ